MSTLLSYRFQEEDSAEPSQWDFISVTSYPTNYDLTLDRGTVYYFFITGVTASRKTDASNFYKYDPEGRGRAIGLIKPQLQTESTPCG